MPTTAAPALVAPRIRFTAPTEREKLASIVLRSPRLLAAVPEEELVGLFTAYNAATKAADAAGRLPAAEGADAVADLDKRLRAGEDIDPAALVAELAEAQTARENRERVIDLLNSRPGRFASEIADVLNDYEDDYYGALSDALTDVLNRAAPVVANLEGVDSAEAAIKAKKAEDWASLIALAQEVSSVRADHFALLRTADEHNFHNDAPALAFAYYRNLDAVLPSFFRVIRKEERDMRGRAGEVPAWVFDQGLVASLLICVRHRDVLTPYVGTADQARTAMGDAHARLAEDGPAGPRPGGQLAEFYGGEAAVARRYFGD